MLNSSSLGTESRVVLVLGTESLVFPDFFLARWSSLELLLLLLELDEELLLELLEDEEESLEWRKGD